MKKNYMLSIPVKTFWTVVVPFFLLALIIGSIAGIVVVDRVVMPRVVGIDKGTIEVPDIQRLSWAEGRQACFDVGLRLNVSGREYNDTIPRNHVIRQQPAPKQVINLEERRRMDVVMSRGSEVVVLPEFFEKNEIYVRKELSRLGFSINDVKKVFSDDVDENIVLRTSPPGGTTLSVETPVEIIVSKGGRPTHVDVPNIVGEQLSQAKHIIDSCGLVFGSVTTRAGTAAPPGTVISQSLPPGTRRPFETTVNVVVSIRK